MRRASSCECRELAEHGAHELGPGISLPGARPQVLARAQDYPARRERPAPSASIDQPSGLDPVSDHLGLVSHECQDACAQRVHGLALVAAERTALE